MALMPLRFSFPPPTRPDRLGLARSHLCLCLAVQPQPTHFWSLSWDTGAERRRQCSVNPSHRSAYRFCGSEP